MARRSTTTKGTSKPTRNDLHSADAVTKKEAEKKTYTVTDKAGPRVAGKRVKAGDKITLTEAEALSELIFGTIVDPEAEEKGE